MNTTRPKIGTITIGQSPRTDVVPEMLEILAPRAEIVEGGALDGLSRDEVARLAPRDGDDVLVTRLRDGTSVLLAEHRILRRMQAEVDRLTSAGADVVALLCTGQFPAFRSSRLVVEPQRLLHHFVTAVGAGRRLGVIVPAREQVELFTPRWRTVAEEVLLRPASPYHEGTDLEQAAADLKAWGAELIVLDCIGFTGGMKARVATVAGVPVILPRTVLARALAELL